MVENLIHFQENVWKFLIQPFELIVPYLIFKIV
jgi:hypothetical protein